jgi:hypothetical protein
MPDLEILQHPLSKWGHSKTPFAVTSSQNWHAAEPFNAFGTLPSPRRPAKALFNRSLGGPHLICRRQDLMLVLKHPLETAACDALRKLKYPMMPKNASRLDATDFKETRQPPLIQRCYNPEL